jgi:PBSX family phage terminase large subunit
LPPKNGTPVDLSRGYTPLPAQAAFHASKARFKLLGGAVGAGKTKAGARESLRTAIAYPGSLGLVGRFTYRRLHDSTMRTFFRELEETGLANRRWTKFLRSDMELSFWNGSRIWFRNLEEVATLLGVELDWAYVDEGTECPDEVFTMLAGRLRGTPKPGGGAVGPLRMWVTTNPGPSPWIRRNFLQAEHPDYAVFQTRTIDNPHLPDVYLETLKQQFTGTWYKRYVLGDWFAWEGQVFSQFDPDVHLIEGFRPDKHHLILEGYDFGIRNPTAVVWIAVDESGEWPPVLFAEHEQSETEVKDHVGIIRQQRNFYGVDEGKVRCFGDPAGTNRGPTLEGSSYFHLYAAEGIYIAPSMKDPRMRAMRISQLLSHRSTMGGKEVPGLLIDRRCTRTIESIVSYRWKDQTSRLGEDPVERFHKHDDHLVDAGGYALVTLEPPTERRKPRLIPGVASYALPHEEREERERVSVSPYGDEV